MEETYSPFCGISRCHLPTVVHISKHGITRCAKHYCEDYDRHKTGHVQETYNPEKFIAENDVIDSLADCDMLQNLGEDKKAYAERCREKTAPLLKKLTIGVIA